MDASIIVPAFNEAKNIDTVLKEIKSVGDYDVIVVDDGSTDGTGKIAKKRARVITIKKNKGKGHACRTGAKAARFQNLVFIDGDGQLPAKYIPLFLKKLNGCDLVVGNRPKKYIPLQRRISNKFASVIIKKITKIDMGDCLCGLRAIRKKDFEKLKLKKDRYEFEGETIIKAAKNNFRIKDVSVKVRYDRYTGMPFVQSMKVAFYLLKEVVF
ncbi:glycosyltransferase family 2 protein [archaeon]|nr:glycosyltransferase family 2 protein [archaeon]